MSLPVERCREIKWRRI